MNLDQMISTYVTDLQPIYKAYALKVQELIHSILKAHSITPHSVTAREKSRASLKAKIVREGKTYEDPLHQVTDLAAVRIITYFPTDVDRIVPILESEFVVDKDHSVDKRKTADPSFFGYASVHLVVELTDGRCKLAEYSPFRGLKCEVQVRTILQHAWAEIEHDIVYKSSEEIPFELRRKFASLAGLLEVADREFEQLRRDEVKVREHIERSVKRENLDTPVNLDSVNFYLREYHSQKIRRPHVVGRFVKMLNALKIETLRQLDDILTSQALAQAQLEIRKVRDACQTTDECLIPFFIAVATHAKLSHDLVARFAECPALRDPEAFKKKRRLQERARFEERIKPGGVVDHEMPNQRIQPTRNPRRVPRG